MKKSELKALIKEEIKNVLNESSIRDIMPVVTQFVEAAKKKYKDNLYDVRVHKTLSGNFAVTAYVKTEKWDLPDKYWSNKFTKNFGNAVPGIEIRFSTIPTTVRGSSDITLGKSVLKELIKEEIKKVLKEAKVTIDPLLINKLKVAMKDRIRYPEDEDMHDELQMLLTQIYQKAGMEDAEELAAGNMEDEVTMTGPVSAVVRLIKDTIESEVGSSTSSGSSSKAAVLIFPGWMTSTKSSHIAIDKTATGSIIRDNMGRPAHWSYSYPGSPMEVLQILTKANAVVKKGSEWFEPNDGLIDNVLESNTKFKEIN